MFLGVSILGESFFGESFFGDSTTGTSTTGDAFSPRGAGVAAGTSAKVASGSCDPRTGAGLIAESADGAAGDAVVRGPRCPVDDDDGDDGDDEDESDEPRPAESDDPAEPPEPELSAFATPGMNSTPAPTPRATANAPTRPTYPDTPSSNEVRSSTAISRTSRSRPGAPRRRPDAATGA
jgi:hypothetical protein